MNMCFTVSAPIGAWIALVVGLTLVVLAALVVVAWGERRAASMTRVRCGCATRIRQRDAIVAAAVAQAAQRPTLRS